MERRLVSHEPFNQQHFCRLTQSITLSLTYYYGAALNFGIGGGTLTWYQQEWRQYISDGILGTSGNGGNTFQTSNGANTFQRSRLNGSNTFQMAEGGTDVENT